MAALLEYRNIGSREAAFPALQIRSRSRRNCSLRSLHSSLLCTNRVIRNRVNERPRHAACTAPSSDCVGGLTRDAQGGLPIRKVATSDMGTNEPLGIR